MSIYTHVFWSADDAFDHFGWIEASFLQELGQAEVHQVDSVGIFFSNQNVVWFHILVDHSFWMDEFQDL